MKPMQRYVMRRLMFLIGLSLACIPMFAQAADTGLQRRSQLGVSFTYSAEGATVSAITDKAAAAAAGLQVGDTVTDVDQMPARNDADIAEISRQLRAGQQELPRVHAQCECTGFQDRCNALRR